MAERAIIVEDRRYLTPAPCIRLIIKDTVKLKEINITYEHTFICINIPLFLTSLAHSLLVLETITLLNCPNCCSTIDISISLPPSSGIRGEQVRIVSSRLTL